MCFLRVKVLSWFCAMKLQVCCTYSRDYVWARKVMKISRARVTASRASLSCFYPEITIVKSTMKNDCETRLKSWIVNTIALTHLKTLQWKVDQESKRNQGSVWREESKAGETKLQILSNMKEIIKKEVIIFHSRHATTSILTNS